MGSIHSSRPHDAGPDSVLARVRRAGTFVPESVVLALRPDPAPVARPAGYQPPDRPGGRPGRARSPDGGKAYSGRAPTGPWPHQA